MTTINHQDIDTCTLYAGILAQIDHEIKLVYLKKQTKPILLNLNILNN